MNETIEAGVVAFLAGQLPEGTVLRKGTEIQEKPTGEKIIIAALRDMPRDVGNLYRGLLTLLIQTPVIKQSDGTPLFTPADHSTAVDLVEYAMNPLVDEDHDAAAVAAIKAALNDAMQEASEFSCSSTYCEGPQSAHNEGHMITTIDVILGLQRL